MIHQCPMEPQGVVTWGPKWPHGAPLLDAPRCLGLVAWGPMWPHGAPLLVASGPQSVDLWGPTWPHGAPALVVVVPLLGVMRWPMRPHGTHLAVTPQPDPLDYAGVLLTQVVGVPVSHQGTTPSLVTPLDLMVTHLSRRVCLGMTL